MSLRIQKTIRGDNIDLSNITATLTPDPNVESGAWGVRRTDSEATVVASGTAMTAVVSATSVVLYYDVTEPEPDLRYEYWIAVTNGTDTWYLHAFADGTSYTNTRGTWGYVCKRYVLKSGNADAVLDAENFDYTDRDGECAFIGNEALDWIERQFKWPTRELWQYETVAANQSMIQLERALYISRVFEQDNDNPDTYGKYPRIEIAWGTLSSGLCPAQQDATASTITDAQDIVFGDTQWARDTIYIAPSSEERRIVIFGGYHSVRVSDPSDINYWTWNHPGILIRAMMLHDETFRRNTAGRNDFEVPLMRDLHDIFTWFRRHELNATGRKIIG